LCISGFYRDEPSANFLLFSFQALTLAVQCLAIEGFTEKNGNNFVKAFKKAMTNKKKKN